MIHKLPGLLFFYGFMLGFMALIFNSWVLFSLSIVLFGLFYLSLFASGWASITEIIKIFAGRSGKDD